LRDPLLVYLRTAGCPYSLAEEIVQEAFLRLHGGLQGGLRLNDVRGWVFRVARNLWIDNRREYQRYWTADRDPAEGSHPSYIDLAPGPEEQALGLERARLTRQELLRLPELQRQCLYLKAQGLAYREIASALDISMNAAVDSVRRALVRLRKRLGR
jgi:RNA polymerase sigma-70 factor (ECF subfamily)